VLFGTGGASTATEPVPPPAPSPACAEGRAAFEAKDYETATTRLEVCVEAHPEDNAALILRGRAYAQLGSWDRAERDLETGLDADATDGRAWAALAFVRGRNGNDRGVVTACDRWLAQDPAAAEALRMRGDAKFRLGDRDGAMADAERSCTLGDADGCTLQTRLQDARKHR
jgi:predicted Zn-dependent protease